MVYPCLKQIEKETVIEVNKVVEVVAEDIMENRVSVDNITPYPPWIVDTSLSLPPGLVSHILVPHVGLSTHYFTFYSQHGGSHPQSVLGEAYVSEFVGSNGCTKEKNKNTKPNTHGNCIVLFSGALWLP